jgi:c-di-GMP-binding flagellar brake protein YcgR
MSESKTRDHTTQDPRPAETSPVKVERRYSIRYSFAVPAEALDLEKGKRCSGRTIDVSTGGCFIASNHPLPERTRVKLRLIHGKESVEILATVRAVRPGIGMGMEFLEIDPAQFAILQRWLAPIQKK